MKSLYLIAILVISFGSFAQDINIDVPSKADSTPEKTPDENAIYDTAGLQAQPEYPGGNTTFKDFILSKIRKTEVPKDIKTLKTYVSFVVEKDGHLTDVKTLRDPGFDIGKKLERAIRQSPKWKPGEQNGKPVRTRYNLPVTINFK